MCVLLYRMLCTIKKKLHFFIADFSSFAWLLSQAFSWIAAPVVVDASLLLLLLLLTESLDDGRTLQRACPDQRNLGKSFQAKNLLACGHGNLVAMMAVVAVAVMVHLEQ